MKQGINHLFVKNSIPVLNRIAPPIFKNPLTGKNVEYTCQILNCRYPQEQKVTNKNVTYIPGVLRCPSHCLVAVGSYRSCYVNRCYRFFSVTDPKNIFIGVNKCTNERPIKRGRVYSNPASYPHEVSSDLRLFHLILTVSVPSKETSLP